MLKKGKLGKVPPVIEEKKPIKTSPVKKEITNKTKAGAEGSFEEKLFAFISEGEGSFQAEAFCDDYYKSNGRLVRKQGHNCGRWSIGYGTISYWGEVITYEEGVRRRNDYIRGIIPFVNQSCWNTNQKIAILDYMYQFGTYSRGIHNYTKQCDVNSVKYILNSSRNSNGGIATRRDRGWNKFNSLSF